MRERPRHQWVAAFLALLMPIGIITAFYYDGQTRLTPLQTITFIDSWPATRSDEEIKAKQVRDQAELERYRRQRQQEFQRLDDKLRRLGI